MHRSLFFSSISILYRWMKNLKFLPSFCNLSLLISYQLFPLTLNTPVLTYMNQTQIHPTHFHENRNTTFHLYLFRYRATIYGKTDTFSTTCFYFVMRKFVCWYWIYSFCHLKHYSIFVASEINIKLTLYLQERQCCSQLVTPNPTFYSLVLQGNGPIRHVETCPDFFFHCKSTHNKIHCQNFSC
jgi:hypothetical protein